MEKKKSINLGFRGWILVIYQAIAFMVHMAFNNFPQNVTATVYKGLYGWDTTMVSTVYTIGIVIGVVINFIFARKLANGKNVMKMSLLFGAATMVSAMGMMVLTNQVVWSIFFALKCIFGVLWATFLVGILVGQWFPRRKGTVMGIATFAFPITTGILLSVFTTLQAEHGQFIGYLPFWIVGVIGLILCAIFLKDYPEQCGCYRDNDKTLDAEAAKQDMLRAQSAKAQSVWTYKNTLKCRDFWFLAIPEGLLLFCAVGIMVQIIPVLASYNKELEAVGGFRTILIGISIFACFGSWVLGVLDTKFGTKTAIIISCIAMCISGVFGFMGNLPCVLIASAFLAIFMGGSSNFTVSGAAEYWGRQDFPSVFGLTNPVANIINALGPMIIAYIAAAASYRYAFLLIGILGVVGAVLCAFVSRKHIEECDAKYRAEAGMAQPAE